MWLMWWFARRPHWRVCLHMNICCVFAPLFSHILLTFLDLFLFITDSLHSKAQLPVYMSVPTVISYNYILRQIYNKIMYKIASIISVLFLIFNSHKDTGKFCERLCCQSIPATKEHLKRRWNIQMRTFLSPLFIINMNGTQTRKPLPWNTQASERTTKLLILN